MTTSSRTKPNGPILHNSFQRSISPSGRFCSSSISSHPTRFLTRPASPTRVNLLGPVSSSSSSVRFSTSPSRSISVSPQNQNRFSRPVSGPKRTCMCSPTNHPGSFRCSLHKNARSPQTASYPSNRLNARRSAMTNSLVRIGTVEGDLVKRALASLIRPSSHHQRRRGDFQARPSRLSVMSKAEDL